jgi:hypothetical protein
MVTPSAAGTHGAYSVGTYDRHHPYRLRNAPWSNHNCGSGVHMLGKLIVIITLGSFLALSCYAWARTHTPWRHVMEDRVHPVFLWRTKQAAALADVYGITADELDKPIRLWEK